MFRLAISCVVLVWAAVLAASEGQTRPNGSLRFEACLTDHNGDPIPWV